MRTYSPMKNQEKNYIIPTTSTPKYHTQHISATTVHSFNLHTTVKLPPVDKEYLCFQNNGKSVQSSRCVK